MKRVLLICLVIFIFAAVPAFSQIPSLGGLQSAMDEFSASLAQSLPFNSTMGLNWSDAYIGQLIGLPPHFGIGFSSGFTTLNMGVINGVMKQFGGELDLPIQIGLPLPGGVIEARVGGFILPFDVGIKFGYLDTNDVSFLGDMLGGVGINYMLVGGDFRYAILDGKAFPVRLSVGVGFNHLRGGISTKIGEGQSIAFSDGSVNYELTMADPTLGLKWESNVLDFKAQASFPLIIITPYLGLGASFAWSKVGYGVDAPLTFKKGGANASLAEVIDIIKGLGVDGIDENGFNRMVEVQSFNARVFGGFSINMAVIRLDFTGMYNFLDASFGVTAGLRFQL